MPAAPKQPINLKVSVDQHAALTEMAKDRDCTVQHLIRAQIATLTGVPDPYRKDRHYRT